MIIKCDYCKREFETKTACKQHEKDAHPEGWKQYQLNKAQKETERTKVPP